MLETILRNVASLDLVDCREVNRKWNMVSSQILRQRTDIQITFSSQKGRLMSCIRHRPFWLQKDYFKTRKKSMRLTDLIDCLEKSKNFPFSSFRFKDLGSDGTGDFERFSSFWGENIHEIAANIDDDENTSNNAEMLRFLLERTANLKRLAIQFGVEWLLKGRGETPLHLFTASNKFELPQLNELRVRGAYTKFTGIVEDILAAAPNLKLFEKCAMKRGNMLGSVTAMELTILHSMGKLHCLKNVSFMFREDLITCLEEIPEVLEQKFIGEFGHSTLGMVERNGCA